MDIIEDEIFDFEYEGVKYYYIRNRKASKIIKSNTGKFIGLYPCIRCGGHGSSTWNRDNGICYECWGSGHSKIILSTTKNIETAKRRLQAKIDKENQKEKDFITDNLKKMKETYTDVFYLVQDTENASTYEEREYLKSKGCKWNPSFRSWWSRDKNGLNKFHLIKVKLEDVLNEYNYMDSDKVYKIIAEYKRELEDKKGVVIS